MLNKVCSEFMAPEVDRLRVKSGDAGKVRDGRGVWLLGK
jgi:hypothetical protein